ncbi:hypothetical protein GGR58DRAFT_506227 [Xylaria digitata]|nr:hypothetical protein GGR58DRAFT_506227 [Xylaria digitata]
MRFTTAFLASVGLAAVHAVPLTPRDATGCRVDLAPTLAQPQNAASNIIYITCHGPYGAKRVFVYSSSMATSVFQRPRASTSVIFYPVLRHHPNTPKLFRAGGGEIQLTHEFLGTLSKWVNSTQSLYFSTSYLDTRNTTKAPFSVVFKDNMIPDFQTTDSIAAVLNTWVGTYLVGGATPKPDDYAITGVSCS